VIEIAVVVVAVLALASMALLGVALRRVRHGHAGRGVVHVLFAVALLGIATIVAIAGFDLATYSRLTHEQPALEATFARSDDGAWQAVLTYPSGATERFSLRGDEWQVDARVIKWRGVANVLGFDTVYRLERLSGRFTDVAQERTTPRSVHALHPDAPLDVWAWLRRHAHRLPGVDAQYGSAVYVPLADGGSYQVTVSQSGLVARPLNAAARAAVGAWR
jgi:hypothetical protein